MNIDIHKDLRECFLYHTFQYINHRNCYSNHIGILQLTSKLNGIYEEGDT